ncbi:MAG: hypothetical protein WA989_08515 [Henriciella sp.]|uniref:tetratricopeptide repeat protein n=1 Tax=Henriciella sp. TaxID=1968823 RepID=UPI003C7191D5
MSRAIRLAVPLLSAALMAGCASTADKEQAAALEEAMAAEIAPATPEEIAEIDRADPLTRANFWAAEFRKDPSSLETTIRFTTSLREIGSHVRAIEVLSSAIPLHPKSDELNLIMGRALMSEGRPGEAADAFYRASVVNPQNASALAGLGVALDQLERHFDAQTAYAAALQIEPDRISTLTNYGLSLALSGKIEQAEERIRYAASLPGADARVRQNLALILGLQGRVAEMEEVDPHAPQRTVEANRATLRSMLAPTRDYGALRGDAGETEEAGDDADDSARQAVASGLSLRGSTGSD